MTKKLYTMEQVHKKYHDVYVSITRHFDYSSGDVRFEIHKTAKTIHENMTLGQDVGTSLAYTR